MARPMPRQAHMNGDVSVRNLRAKPDTKVVNRVASTDGDNVRHCQHSRKQSNGIYNQGKETESFPQPLPTAVFREADAKQNIVLIVFSH